MSELKRKAAEAALRFLDEGMIVGVGTGSTVHYFIEALGSMKHRLDACVASSKESERLLKKRGIPVIDLNVASRVDVVVDGADEVNVRGEMIKGGGGALTREKILAFAAKKRICIIDESKFVKNLGAFPVAVEVIPMARSLVARELVKLGGSPNYRQGVVTDNGNILLDVHQLNLENPYRLEEAIKLIPGVVETGIFSKQKANTILIGRASTVEILAVV